MSTSATRIDGYYLFASSSAGLIARTITYPMDTIKTRLQTTTQKGTPIELLKRAIFSYKITSLYRGLPVTLLFSVPALSVYLSCYEITKQLLDQDHNVARDSVTSHLVSGCAAEVAAGILFTPMEVMKNRLQTTTTTTTATTTATTRSLFKHILQKEGIRGFYKGYWMGLVVFVPHSMAYFVTYEKMKQWLIKDQEQRKKFQYYMASSSIAGVTSIMLSTPLDIIKTRWQISAAEQGTQFRQGPIGIAKRMWINEGKDAFMRGLGARIAWGIPTTAISMTVFELLKNHRQSIFPISSSSN